MIDRQAFWNGTPETTDEKLRWVREGAGDRDPELHVRVHLAMVTDDRDGIVEQLAGGFGLTPTRRARPRTRSSATSARSATSSWSAASDGGSATSACPPTSSSPSRPVDRPPRRHLTG